MSMGVYLPQGSSLLLQGVSTLASPLRDSARPELYVVFACVLCQTFAVNVKPEQGGHFFTDTCPNMAGQVA